MSMALALTTVFRIWIQPRYIAPRSFTTVTGKGFRPNVLDLGGWKWVALGYNLAFIFVAVVLPIFCLAVVSLHPVWTGKIIPWGPEMAERLGIVHVRPDGATLYPIRYTDRLWTVFRAAAHTKLWQLDTYSFAGRTPREAIYGEPTLSVTTKEEATA